MKIYWARATFAAALSVSPIFTRTARASAPSSFAFTKAVQVVRRLSQSAAASTATSNLFSLNKLIDLELSQLNEIWRSEQTIEPAMFCWRAAWAPLLKRQTFLCASSLSAKTKWVARLRLGHEASIRVYLTSNCCFATKRFWFKLTNKFLNKINRVQRNVLDVPYHPRFNNSRPKLNVHFIYAQRQTRQVLGNRTWKRFEILCESFFSSFFSFKF